MDFLQELLNQVEPLRKYTVLIAIPIVGFLGALILAGAARGALSRLGWDRKIAQALARDGGGTEVNVSRWTGRFVYYLVLGITLVAFLDRLHFSDAAEPIKDMLSSVFEYAPNLIGASILVVSAWISAHLLRFLSKNALTRFGIDEKLSGQLRDVEGADVVPVSKTVSETIYWLVYLLFLPAILDALDLEGLLRPVRDMFAKVLTFLPNLISAAVIFLIGWFTARIVQRIVTNVLASSGADRLSQKVGITKALGTQKFSNLVGVVVHILIIIPVAIAALNALKLNAIARPASQMLGTILEALPHVFAAGLVLVVSYFIGRIVADLVTNLLSSAGFDNILVKLGVSKQAPRVGLRRPATVGGDLVMIAIMLFAFIEAANLLGFKRLSRLTQELLELGGHVLLGLALFALGLYLSNAAAKAIENSQINQNRLLATIARLAILILAGAMGLRQMGLANDIITTAFTLCLGAVAVAFALAFGLGGREEAAAQLREWRQKLKMRS